MADSMGRRTARSHLPGQSALIRSTRRPGFGIDTSWESLEEFISLRNNRISRPDKPCFTRRMLD